MDQLRAVDPLASGWIVGVLLLAVGVLAWVNMVSPRQWTLLARSFATFRLGPHRLREGLDLRDRTLIGLVLLAVATIALFIYQVALFFGWVEPGILSFLWLALLVMGVFLAQLAVLSALRLLPDNDEALREYLHTVVVLHVVLGLVLLPISAILSFPGQVVWRPWVVATGLAVIGGTCLFRWVRAVAVGRGGGAPMRYIFLYLCTLEILPVALALEQIKELVSQIPNP